MIAFAEIKDAAGWDAAISGHGHLVWYALTPEQHVAIAAKIQKEPWTDFGQLRLADKADAVEADRRFLAMHTPRPATPPTWPRYPFLDLSP